MNNISSLSTIAQRLGRSVSQPSIALMQPTFIPWQGYFYLISCVDTFVILDDFQFCRSSWHHRNRLFKSPDKADWYSVPVENKSGMPNINDVAVNDRTNWRDKTLRTVVQVYKKAKHFEEIFPLVETWLNYKSESLSAFNENIIKSCCDLLQIKTKIILSSSLNSQGSKSAHVIDIIKKAGAKFYLAAPGSYGYMYEEKALFDAAFNEFGLDLAFYQYNPSSYAQHGASKFHSHLSIIDTLLNVGVDQTKALLAANSANFLDWAGMQARIEQEQNKPEHEDSLNIGQNIAPKDSPEFE